MTRSDQMHVLHVIDGLGLGGAERVLVDLANQSVADGLEVSVCVTRDQLTRARELDPRIEVLVLRRTRRISPSAMYRFLRWVRTRRPDIIHVHMRSSAAHMLMLRALHLLRVPVIFHDHYGGIEIDRAVPMWFRLGHRFIGHYVGVSDALRDWARDGGVTPERSTTIGNAIDLATFRTATVASLREELGLAAGVPLGLVVATLRADKGIDLLLDSVAAIPGPIHVAIAGATGEPAYAAACHDKRVALRLEDRVTFLGGRQDVPSLMRAADFALLSSRTESGPLVLAEYLAAGLPVVATRVGDIGQRLASAGVPGFVPAGDVGAFTTELAALLALSPGDRRDRGERGRRLLTERWDIRSAMPRWYALYRTVMSAGCVP